jgi:VWFA-related protein
VYWLTAGFPLQGQGLSGGALAHLAGTAETGGQMVPTQEKTDKDLEKARVAIYSIDARGVAPQDITGETSADVEGAAVGKGGVNQDNTLNAAQTAEMRSIASATGGVATFSNDIAKTLRNEFARSESYYTISYTPANTDWKGGYRRIQLSLDKPGNQLIYREGYYAKDPQSPSAPTKEEFRQALVHGAPAATEVLFTAKLTKSADAANVEYTIDPRTIEY